MCNLCCKSYFVELVNVTAVKAHLQVNILSSDVWFSYPVFCRGQLRQKCLVELEVEMLYRSD